MSKTRSQVTFIIKNNKSKLIQHSYSKEFKKKQILEMVQEYFEGFYEPGIYTATFIDDFNWGSTEAGDGPPWEWLDIKLKLIYKI